MVAKGIVMELIFGLLLLVANIWAFINIIGSPATTGSKLVWAIVIILLPLIGFIIWYFAGPRSKDAQ